MSEIIEHAGLLTILVGGVMYGLGRQADVREFPKYRFWLSVMGVCIGGAGSLWHGHTSVTNIWTLLLALPVSFITWGLGYSVFRR